MRLDTKLTKSGHYFSTAGLATIEDYNEDVPSGVFRADVLEKFAEELADVDGPVEVSVQNLDYSDQDGSDKALIGRVEGTDVACVAAPLIESTEEADA